VPLDDDIALRIYLDDHLAGAASGARLARKVAQRSAGTAEHAGFARLAADVEADRVALMQLRGSLGLRRRSPKELVGMSAECVSRLKFTLMSARDASAGRLLELETLALGIHGKLAMWRALDACAGDDGGLDLAELVRRAESQHSFVEAQRLAVAKQSLRTRRLPSVRSGRGDGRRVTPPEEKSLSDA
jgi:hypothetical protein